MNILPLIETTQNIFDFGIILESIRNSKKRKFEMDFGEFIKHLLFGRGYFELTPPKLSEKLKHRENKILIVDLREKKQFEKYHIDGVISREFDDFFRGVFVQKEFNEFRKKDIVLVCDTGHMSRVAGSFLSDEGFERVFSLKRGMRRWVKWERLILSCKKLEWENGLELACCCKSL